MKTTNTDNLNTTEVMGLMGVDIRMVTGVKNALLERADSRKDSKRKDTSKGHWTDYMND